MTERTEEDVPTGANNGGQQNRSTGLHKMFALSCRGLLAAHGTGPEPNLAKQSQEGLPGKCPKESCPAEGPPQRGSGELLRRS